MPQVFQVLRCFKCCVFQVHQVKKSNKWECKICGEKQSVKRHYGTGTAKDCRFHVQKLNGIRSEIDDDDSVSSDGKDLEDLEDHNNPKNTIILGQQTSRWSSYVDKSEDIDEIQNQNEENKLDGYEVVLELPKTSRKRRAAPDKTIYKRRAKFEVPVLNKIYDPQDFLPIFKEDEEIGDKLNNENIIYATEAVIQNNPTKINNVNKFSKNIIQPITEKASKWSQFMDQQETVNAIADEENIMEINEINLPNNSKWKPFVEQQNDMKENEIILSENKHEQNMMELYEPKIQNCSNWEYFLRQQNDLEEDYMYLNEQENNVKSENMMEINESKTTNNYKWNYFFEQQNDLEESELYLNKNDIDVDIEENGMELQESKLSKNLKILNRNRVHDNFKPNKNNTQTMFSMCDDSDIDDILNF